MKKTTWVILTLLLLAGTRLPAQSLRSASFNKQFQVSLQNGVSSFLGNPSLDSVYFLKSGYQAGLQGNYYWNNVGLAGRAGYFTNSSDRQALEDFARSRRAPRDRAYISSGSYKGLYFLMGPAFQSSFNKWQLQSSLEGGLVSKPASQVLIGDNFSPDIVYYRNVFDRGNSFAWSAGLSISYALSSQILLGLNADYLNTKNEVVNYDIQRGGGREAKNISSQAGFLNTGIRLSYLFNTTKAREPASGLASGKRTVMPAVSDDDITNKVVMNNTASNAGKIETQTNNDNCKCEDQVMEVREMEPYIVEIQFETVQEARVFLDTYEPLLQRRDLATGQASGKRQHGTINSNPLYQPSGNSGENPLYQGNKRTTISNAQGVRGVVQRDAQGGQAFYLLPSVLDLSEVLSLQDGRVTVHVQYGSDKNEPGQQQRGVGTGLPNGKRMYKAIAVGDVDGDGRADLVLRSGFNHEIKTPRDVATGQSSGRVAKIDAFTIKQGIVIEADLDGDGEFEPLGNVKSPRDVATGQASGKRTAAKEDVYVWKIKYAPDLDGDGIEDGFVCSGLNPNADLMSHAKTFSIVIGDEKAPESGIKQTMQTQVLTTSNDGSTDNPVQKAGISTSRSNIRTKSIVSCSDGSCVMAGEIELDGKIYTALITARAKHDTVKNAIGNIR